MLPANIHHHRLLPAEHEVTDGGAQGHGQTEPDVVRHEDEHQAVGQHDLYKLKNCLKEVTPGEDAGLDDLDLVRPAPPLGVGGNIRVRSRPAISLS